nr:ATP-binding protein [Nitrosomonas nitrosa]
MGQEPITNPLAIKRISLEELFGIYSYSIPGDSAIDSSNAYSQLLILYGDNGSGKTTILQLVLHLLSAEKNGGHRTFLAQRMFKRLEVELGNGTCVLAERNGPELIGAYTLSISKNDKVLAQCSCVVNEANNVVSGEDLDNVLQHLHQLNLAIYFLADDRKVAQSLTASRAHDEEMLFRKRMVLGQGIAKSEESRQDINIKKAIQSLTQWVRQQVLKAASIGQDNSNTIYAHVVNQIASERTASALGTGATSTSMISAIEDLGTRNNQFAEFGLIAQMNIDTFKQPLQDAPKESHQLMAKVLQPYFDGIAAKLDALHEIYGLLKLFTTHMNSFYSNKTVAFSLQNGLTINSSNGNRLLPRMLSSGEKQLLLLFCNTLIARDKSAIFIIDEPEISLNVKWQRRLLKALLDFISGSNIQFLLATHSLELLALHRSSIAKLSNSLSSTGE